MKLDGFDAASKIKVIKEIRSVTELGLKEAKELVSKARPDCLKGSDTSHYSFFWRESPAVYLNLRLAQSRACVQVEKSPVVVKSGLKKEEAEALQKKLEAGELEKSLMSTELLSLPNAKNDVVYLMRTAYLLSCYICLQPAS